jgi:hypothetical protein
MRRLIALPSLLLLTVAFMSPALAQNVPSDSYDGMLQYLTSTRIDGQAMSGASGVVGVNMAAGDFNQQANLRAFAVGPNTATRIRASQLQDNNLATSPDRATASIGGSAFHGAQGVLSINQASGSSNTELNVVSAALASQGIREAGDAWFATASASAGGTVSPAPMADTAKERHVAVESTALREVQGVVQLNQVAGSANAAANVLQLSVSPSQR